MKFTFRCILLCIFVYSNSLFAQTAYVKIKPITKYDFQIVNHAPVKMEVTLSGIETFTLGPGQQRTFESDQVKRTTTMQLGYEVATYEAVKAKVEARGYRLKTEDVLADEAYKKAMEASDRIGPTTRLRQGWFGGYYLEDDYSARGWAKIISSGVYGNKKSSIQQEQLANEQLAMVNIALHTAANEKADNRYSKDFEPIYIKRLIRSKILLSPKAKLEINARLFRSDLNEYWSKNSEDLTWGVTFARRLFGEKRLGKTLNLTALYGFASWQKQSFGLDGGNTNSYLLDSTYIKFPDKSFYQLRTTEHVNLNINQFSLGLMGEIYFYPSVFLNVRLGYNVLNRSNLEFEEKNDENEIIGHLNASYEFDKRKNKEAIFFEGGKFYGEARLGFYLSKSQKRRPRQGYYVAVGYQIKPRTTFEHGTNNALYQLTDNNRVKVPVMDKNNGKYQSSITLSIGIAM